MGLSDEVKAQIEQEAAACGNSFEKSEFVCPKNVVNPGLFFGYMIGATKWADQFDKCIDAYEFNREATLERLMKYKKALQAYLDEENWLHSKVNKDGSRIVRDIQDMKRFAKEALK